MKTGTYFTIPITYTLFAVTNMCNVKDSTNDTLIMMTKQNRKKPTRNAKLPYAFCLMPIS